MYVAGHALVKAALFLCVGIVLHRLGTVDESSLHGRGRPLRLTGIVFTVAAFGLADLPPFATFLGKGWIEDSSSALGLPWLTALFVVASVIVGGAVLRVAGGVFYGLGDAPGEDPQMARESSEETWETVLAKHRTPLTMIIPAAGLAGAALLLGFAPHLGGVVEGAAVRFQDQAGYEATVPSGAQLAHPVALYKPEPAVVTLSSPLTAVGSATGSVLLAGAALYWRRLPLLRRGFEPGTGLVRSIRRFQSGVVNDYVTWIVLGLACVGGALTATIR